MNIRITQNSVRRQYNTNVNSVLNQMNDLNNKMNSHRKLNRASENPLSAAKAILIRKNLAELDSYDANLDDADGMLTSAETSLKTISTVTDTVTTKIIYAANGDKSQDELDIIANEIENVALDMINNMNVDYADRRIFGGTNNSTQAFEYDASTNTVTYNGVPVSKTLTYKDDASLYQDASGQNYVGGTVIDPAFVIDNNQDFSALTPGTTYYMDSEQTGLTITDVAGTKTYTVTNSGGATTDITALVSSGDVAIGDISVSAKDSKTYYNSTKITDEQATGTNSSLFPGSGSVLVDVGIGIEFDSDGNVDPSTAFDISLNGAEYTGCGTDEDGDSLNLIQLCFDAAAALKKGDKAKAMELKDKISDSKSTMLVGITKLGVKEKSIEYNTNKIANDRLNLQESQTNIEGMTTIDLTAAYTEYILVKSAYDATLQLGSDVLPSSLFDFIR